MSADCKNKDLNPHREHRQRLKGRFLKEGGFDNFQPHEVLELLLFYVIPQRNTNDIAHALINHFGSLENVFSASVEQLMKVSGIKQESATYIKIFNELNRFRQITRKSPNKLETVEDFIEYLKPKFYGKRNEVSMLICLDNNNIVKCCKVVLEGQINYTSIDPRKVVDIALNYDAAYVVLAHNHPGGTCEPSGNDVSATRNIRKLLMQINVKMIDHIIVSPNGCYSMASDPQYVDIFINKK